MINRKLLLLLILLVTFSIGASCNTIYVKPTGDDVNTGASWDAAKKTVQAGINSATVGDEVWVAKGLYSECITMKAGVGLYGGFSGSETGRDQRNWKTNNTVIDCHGNNSLIGISAGSRDTIVDGFTLNGRISNFSGGTIYCSDCSPTIRNNTIFGGINGIYCYQSSPLIRNNSIIRCDYKGIFIDWKYSIFGWPSSKNIAPEIDGNKIVGNLSIGIVCRYESSVYEPVPCQSPLIHNNIIKGNNGGIDIQDCSANIYNNIICGNTPSQSFSSYTGYGISVHGYAKNPVKISNNTIAANYANSMGVIQIEKIACNLANNIIAFNSPGVSINQATVTWNNNCVYSNSSYNFKGFTDPTGSNGNISSDPRLENVELGRMRLLPDSQCIDMGCDDVVQNGWTDIDGSSRSVDGNNDTIPNVDMGADEYDGSIPSSEPVIIRVNLLGNDMNDGLTWATAKKTIQAGIDTAAITGGEVWVKAGTYVEKLSLPSGVELYGGFNGTESSRNERNWKTNITTLDSPGYNITAYCRAFGGCIDGFTITKTNSPEAGFINLSYSTTAIRNNLLSQKQPANISTYMIVCYYSDPTICNNILCGSFTYGYFGSAIALGNSSSGIVSNNTIVGNSGYAIECGEGNALICNNIIAYNNRSIMNSSINTHPTIRNNCYYGQKLGAFTYGEGDFIADPLFVDRANGDYHLSVESPCINKGWNDASGVSTTDIDGEPRVQRATIDIGADECWLKAGSIKSMKRAADGVLVEVGGSYVTAAFPSFFYIETAKRETGIRVDKTSNGVTVGEKVSVTGSVMTNEDGERVITADTVTEDPTESLTVLITPLAITNKALGGVGFGLQAGVKNGYGLNNIGLLVKCWGKVYRVGSDYFIGDGNKEPVRVILPDGVNIDASWENISITGISSCQKVDGELVRVLRVRNQDDIVKIK